MKLGNYDKWFLFFSRGDKAAVAEFRCCLDVPVVPERVKEAVKLALKQFPFFRLRPFIDSKNDSVIFKENTEEVPVFTDRDNNKDKADKYLYLGSNESNGYLFSVHVHESDSAVNIIASHVIGDVRAVFFFVRLLIHYYLRLSGCKVDPALVPYSEAEAIDERCLETIDDACMKINTVPDNADKNPENVFIIPEEAKYAGTAFTRDFTVIWNNSEMLNAVHALGTSFLCFVNAVLAEAIYRNYDVGNAVISSGVPVDMRAMLNSKSQLNFTRNISLNYEPSYQSISMKEKTQLLRTQLKSKITLNNLAAGVNGFSPVLNEVMKLPLTDQVKIFSSMYNSSSKARTFLLSNVGAVNFPDDMQAHILDFKMYSTNLEDTPVYVLLSENEDGMLLAGQNYDDTKILESFCDILKDYGVSAKVIDNGKFQCHRLNLEYFSKI